MTKEKTLVIIAAVFLFLSVSNVLASSVTVNLNPMGDVYAWNYPSQDANRNGAALQLYFYNAWMSRVYMMWNMTGVPSSGIYVNSAQVCMNYTHGSNCCDNSDAGTVSFGRVFSSSWNETTVTWNNQPCGIPPWGTDAPSDPSKCSVNAESVNYLDSNANNSYNCYDVTNLVRQDRIFVGGQNLSMVLWKTNSYWSVFSDRESLFGDIPYMNITYTNCSELGYITPTGDDNNITNATALCPGVYYINDTNNNGVFQLQNHSSLNCNGAAFIGNNAGKFVQYAGWYSFMNLSNCDVTNYTYGFYGGSANQPCYTCNISNNKFTRASVWFYARGDYGPSDFGFNNFYDTSLTVETNCNGCGNEYVHDLFLNRSTMSTTSSNGENYHFENITILNSPSVGLTSDDWSFWKNITILNSTTDGLRFNTYTYNLRTWIGFTIMYSGSNGINYDSATRYCFMSGGNLYNSTVTNNTVDILMSAIKTVDGGNCGYRYYNVTYGTVNFGSSNHSIIYSALLIGNITNSSGIPVQNVNFSYNFLPAGDNFSYLTNANGQTPARMTNIWVQNRTGYYYHGSPNIILRKAGLVKAQYTQNFTNFMQNYANLQINSCLMPVDDYVTDESGTVVVCPGTYYISDTNNNGVILLNASSISLDCNNSATFIGGYAGTFINGSSANLANITRCNIDNYANAFVSSVIGTNWFANNTLHNTSMIIDSDNGGGAGVDYNRFYNTSVYLYSGDYGGGQGRAVYRYNFLNNSFFYLRCTGVGMCPGYTQSAFIGNQIYYSPSNGITIDHDQHVALVNNTIKFSANNGVYSSLHYWFDAVGYKSSGNVIANNSGSGWEFENYNYPYIYNSTIVNNTGCDLYFAGGGDMVAYNVTYGTECGYTGSSHIWYYNYLIGNITNSTGQPVGGAVMNYTDLQGTANVQTTNSSGFTQGAWVLGWMQNDTGRYYHNSPNFAVKKRPEYVKTAVTINLTNFDINYANIRMNNCLLPVDDYIADEDGAMSVCSGNYVINDTGLTGTIIVSTDNIQLKCNNTSLGGEGIWFNLNGHSNITIDGCNFTGLSDDAYTIPFYNFGPCNSRLFNFINNNVSHAATYWVSNCTPHPDNITIYNNRWNTGCLFFDGVATLNFTDNYINNSNLCNGTITGVNVTGAAIYDKGTGPLYMIGNTIVGGNYGIWIDANVSSCTIRNNHISGAANYGLVNSFCQPPSFFTDNIITGNANGIRWFRGGNITALDIYNSTINNNSVYDITIDGLQDFHITNVTANNFLLTNGGSYYRDFYGYYLNVYGYNGSIPGAYVYIYGPTWNNSMGYTDSQGNTSLTSLVTSYYVNSTDIYPSRVSASKLGWESRTNTTSILLSNAFERLKLRLITPSVIYINGVSGSQHVNAHTATNVTAWPTSNITLLRGGVPVSNPDMEIFDNGDYVYTTAFTGNDDILGVNATATLSLGTYRGMQLAVMAILPFLLIVAVFITIARGYIGGDLDFNKIAWYVVLILLTLAFVGIIWSML